MNELWNDLVPSDTSIDQDSFLQLYRTIDNLFEDEEEEELGSSPVKSSSLEQSFAQLCDDASVPSISRSALIAWDEIQDLFQENLLSEQEFDRLWSQSLKSQTLNPIMRQDQLTLEGFLYFNDLLDDLFILEENEIVDDGIQSVSQETTSSETKDILFFKQDSSPQELFARIAADQKTISLDIILKRWGNLQEMIRDGDLSKDEVLELYQRATKTGYLDCEAFVVFYNSIESLFEDEEEEDENNEDVEEQSRRISSKAILLNLISDVASDASRLPCGLECTEEEIQQIAGVVKYLERESSNMLVSRRGSIKESDIAGTWKMIYTSSSALKFNKGISGLVPPTGKFGGLIQKLKASKFMLDLEYVETVNAGAGSFEVRVTGDWEIKSSMSLFTGEQAMALKVEPNLVLYGITTQKADHWKSLGPMNLLDISYLDDDLRIMRGSTSSESIFIFKKL